MAEEKVMASQMLNRSVPGPNWSTENILQLARELLVEVGDLNGNAMYRLSMLAMQNANQSSEVRQALAKLRAGYWKAQNKVPPKTELAL